MRIRLPQYAFALDTYIVGTLEEYYNYLKNDWENDMWDLIQEEIRDATRTLVEAQTYDEAIFKAFKYVEGEIQERIASTNIGQALLSEAFDGSPPKIIISSDPRDQQGIKELFSGALSSIRNDRGHKKQPSVPCTTQKACLLYLAQASFLMYLLNQDKNIFPQIEYIGIFGETQRPRAEIRGKNFNNHSKVLAEVEEATVVRVENNLMEILLPYGFVGYIWVMDGDKCSNRVHCDAHFIDNEYNNWNEIISVEVPLYADKECTKLRTDVVGMILRVHEGGKSPYLRITPTHSGKYTAGYYVSHGPFLNVSVGETWYRDPHTQAIEYAWTSSSVNLPEVICKSGNYVLGGISIAPRVIKCELIERRALSVFGWERDGEIMKELPIASEQCSWSSSDERVAYVKKGIVYPKSLGTARIECQYEKFITSASITVSHFANGERAVVYQGISTLQQICFDDADNLYICNQGTTVYQLSPTGECIEVVKLDAGSRYSPRIDSIAVDSDRNLYVNDILHRRCLKFAWDGSRYKSPIVFGTSVVGVKKGIAIGDNGDIYIAVMGNQVGEGGILHVSADGKEDYFPTLDVATDICIDDGGSLYVPSRKDKAVHVYNSHGTLIDSLPYNRTDSPSAICISPGGEVYVTFFSSGSLIRLRRGTDSVDCIADGFFNPCGVAINSTGKLYISNFSSKRSQSYIEVLY